MMPKEPENAYVVKDLKTGEDEVIIYYKGATVPKRARPLKGHNYYKARPMEKGLRKVRKSIETREDKARIPVIKGPRRTKRKPTKKEQEMDRRLQLQELTPNIHKIIEESQKAGGGKVKGYKKGGSITYRMAGGQVVDNSYD